MPPPPPAAGAGAPRPRPPPRFAAAPQDRRWSSAGPTRRAHGCRSASGGRGRRPAGTRWRVRRPSGAESPLRGTHRATRPRSPPSDVIGARRCPTRSVPAVAAGPELLVRTRSGRVPADHRRAAHRITRPRRGSAHAPLPEPCRRRAGRIPTPVPGPSRGTAPARPPATELHAAGWAGRVRPVRRERWRDRVGEDVVLARPGPGDLAGERSTLAEYDAGSRPRAVAKRGGGRRARAGEPSGSPSAGTARGGRRCEAELVRDRDISLVVRGETPPRCARSAWARWTLAALDPARGAADPGGRPAVPGHGAEGQGRDPRAGRGPPDARVAVPRADVEVGVDMESFGEYGAYLWGALLRHPAAAGRADEPSATALRHLGSAAHPDEDRSFAELWTWFYRLGRGPPPPPHVRAYATTRRRETAGCCLGAAVRRPPGVRPGRRGAVVAISPGSTCTPWSASGSVRARQGTQARRPVAGSPGAIRGERGELDALVPGRGRDGRRGAGRRQRNRLLQYNRATTSRDGTPCATG